MTELALASPGSERASRLHLWSGSRIWFLGAIVTYMVTLWTAYVLRVVPIFEYFGLGYNASWTWPDVVFVVGLAILPALWLPARLERPSQLFVLAQYLIVYVPGLILAYHSVLPELRSAQRVALCVTMFLGMTIMQAAQRFWPLLRITRIPLRPGVYYGVLGVCLVLGMLYLVQLLGAHFRFAGLSDVYDVREDASRSIESSGSRFGGYVFTWLDGFILPLLYAIALKRKHLWLGLVVVGAYALLYGLWASKISLLAPIYLLALYALVRLRKEYAPAVFVLGCATACAVPLFIADDGPVSTLIRDAWITVINVRVFCVPGLLIAQYLQFFSEHALTFGSHITGLNAFIPYPYDYDVPRTVGYYYYGVLVTSNVNYWAQDGLAAFGLPGIPLISLVASVTYWILDSVTRTIPMQFVLVALGTVLFTISDNSLFTTLVTGGLLFFLVAFFLAPLELSVGSPPRMARLPTGPTGDGR